MKKIALGILAAAAAIAATNLMAATADMKGYYSTQEKTKLTAKATATDITIYDSSSSEIYVTVPGTPIYDMIYSGGYDHIRHNSYTGSTRIVLQDPWHQVFFDGYVCRYGIVNVTGHPNNYRIDVNSTYCY